MRWPWQRKTEASPVVDPIEKIDKDQIARLKEAKKATARTVELVTRAQEQQVHMREHIQEMNTVGTTNHFADLIVNYAFKGKNA